MAYTFSNEADGSIITSISMESSTYGTFDPPSEGSFPIGDNEQVSGDFSTLTSTPGNPNAKLQINLSQGGVQADTVIDGELYSTTIHGSGISYINLPTDLDNSSTLFIEFSVIPS
jgi:hypothetical protein